MEKIRHIDVHRALKKVLKRNYDHYFLNVYICPERTEWYSAIRFRNDAERKWHPRITVFYPATNKVAVLDRLGDTPLWVDAATIITMAETAAQPKDGPPKIK